MLVEDVFEQVRSQTYIPITLQELDSIPSSCLHAFDHLLGQLAASREAVKQNESESQDKINHLSNSISHLTEQNAVLQTRLIASLDALSTASSDVLDRSKDELIALRLLNLNLSMRLHDAHRENSELREALNNAAEPTRVINGPSAIRRVQVVANERIQPVRLISEVQQDDDGVSDAETERPAQYMPTVDILDYPQAGPSTLRRPQSTAEMRLRTRTILLELANELESTRREVASIQSDKERVVALLQSQIDSRNKELSTLYGQLDRFFGLPGFALTKSRKKQALEREQILGETAHEGEEVAEALRQQLRQLKVDIERLSAERDNIARYGVGPSLGEPITIPLHQQEAADDEIIASRLAEQEASFERVARRARERLLEQESVISSLKNELSKAQESLQSIQDSRHEDVFSATYHGPSEIHLDRLGVGASIPRPKSAFADPHAGSMLFKDGSSNLTRPWVP